MEKKPTADTSQSLMALSSDPDARVLESGLHAIIDMPARWPSRVWSCLPVAVSHILIVASAADHSSVSHWPRMACARYFIDSQQLAIDRPSGENRTAATPLLWPFKTFVCLYRTNEGFFLGGVAILGVTMGLSIEGASRDCRWLLFQPSR